MNQQATLESGTVSGADATDTAYITNGGPNKVLVKNLRIEPKVSVATHAANYITTAVKKGSTTIASHTTNSSGGSALTAGTILDMTISGTGTDIVLDAGGILKVDITKAGTGPAYNHRVIATVEDVRL